MKPRFIQIIWAIAAAAMLTAASLLQAPLDRLNEQYELVPPGNVVLENNPEFALLQVAPGGLRAVVVNWLWIRAEALKNEGQFHESMQLAEMICRLQPRFAGVWGFQAWNMAWNISVATHTPDERWLWVNNGVRLLRDEGIPLNPKSLLLYKELGWIFFAKMDMTMDEMHMVYKARWAAEMQRLLGAPPVGETKEVIAAFRPIAEAPLDKDPRRQGKAMIQLDQLEKLETSDERVRQYLAMLAAAHVAVSPTTEQAKSGWMDLLNVYDRFSLDEDVDMVRLFPPVLKTDQDRQLSAIINDGNFSKARGKLLAFVRAQILWNEYKMDPQWMLDLMEKYGPLDWRLAVTHGLYWVTYGLHICEGVKVADIDSLNTDRIVLDCLKKLTWGGRLSYFENPADPSMPQITRWADWRFIQPSLAEFERFIAALSKTDPRGYVDNALRAGHLNYIIAVLQMLYASDRTREAEEIFRETKEKYNLQKTPEWNRDLGDFVAYMMSRDTPIPDLAINQITAAIVSSFSRRAAGDVSGSQALMRYAQLVYDVSQKDASQRVRLAPLRVIAASIVADLLVRPEIHGRILSLEARSSLYRQLDNRTQIVIYDAISTPLRAQCQHAGLDFDKAFPPPEGLDKYRQAMERAMQAPIPQK